MPVQTSISIPNPDFKCKNSHTLQLLLPFYPLEIPVKLILFCLLCALRVNQNDRTNEHRRSNKQGRWAGIGKVREA